MNKDGILEKELKAALKKAFAPKSNLLSNEEVEVLDTLRDAWNQFNSLQELHPQDKQEFLSAIHRAQDIVMSRPVQREQKRTEVLI